MDLNNYIVVPRRPSSFSAPLYPPPMFLKKFDRVNNVSIAYLVQILLKNYFVGEGALKFGRGRGHFL